MCRWSPSWQKFCTSTSVFQKKLCLFSTVRHFGRMTENTTDLLQASLILLQERGLVHLGHGSNSSSSNQSWCWRTLFQLEMSTTGLHICTAWLSYISPISAASGQQAIGVHSVLSSCLLLCVQHSAVCSKVTTILPSSTAAENVMLRGDLRLEQQVVL